MDQIEPSDSGSSASSMQKRKREIDSADGRRVKPEAPGSTAVNVNNHDFLGNTVSIAQAAQAQVAQDHVNVDDFSALAQATGGPAGHVEHPQQAQHSQHPQQPEHSQHSQPPQHPYPHSQHPEAPSASKTATAALTIYPTLHVPPSTEQTFAAQIASEQHHDDGSYSASAVSPPDGLPAVAPTAPMQANGVQEPRYGSSSGPSGPKPAVGSEEWHKMRKDNHKEVERRRRETINEGINELAKIVPGCEKNKGSILQRAVSFITQLKENETQNIEKWTLEKLLTEQAIAELSQSNDKLKNECERLYEELDRWKKLALQHGLDADKEESGSGSSS